MSRHTILHALPHAADAAFRASDAACVRAVPVSAVPVSAAPVSVDSVPAVSPRVKAKAKKQPLV